MKSNSPARSGAILICVLACMVIATSLSALSLQACLRFRQEARLPFLRQQSEWLLQAGVERARKKLRKDPKYIGERWDIPESVLTVAQGIVTISRQDTDGLQLTSPVAEQGFQQETRFRVIAQLLVPDSSQVLCQVTYDFQALP